MAVPARRCVLLLELVLVLLLELVLLLVVVLLILLLVAGEARVPCVLARVLTATAVASTLLAPCSHVAAPTPASGGCGEIHVLRRVRGPATRGMREI